MNMCGSDDALVERFESVDTDPDVLCTFTPGERAAYVKWFCATRSVTSVEVVGQITKTTMVDPVTGSVVAVVVETTIDENLVQAQKEKITRRLEASRIARDRVRALARALSGTRAPARMRVISTTGTSPRRGRRARPAASRRGPPSSDDDPEPPGEHDALEQRGAS